MSVPAKPVTLINVLSVEPNKQKQLLALLGENIETVIKALKGWIGTDLIASADGSQVVIRSQWETSADIEAMRTNPRMVAYFPRVAELASLNSIAGEVVMSHRR